MWPIDGSGKFRDITMLAGVGYSEAGIPQAGMGVDLGDYDNDLDLDLVVTNLSNETNELYNNRGRGIFTDPTFSSGLGSPGLLYVGFGVAWMDADADGDQDLMIANGHILENVHLLSDAITYAQRNHLFENLGGGRFREVGQESGPGLELQEVNRGLALGDMDADGDEDVVLSSNGGRAVLLLNQSPGQGHWLQLRLRSSGKNRFAVGARVEVEAGGRSQVREVRAGHSYQSQSDMSLHFGLGAAATVAACRVRWPDGTRESFALAAVNRAMVLEQGSGAALP